MTSKQDYEEVAAHDAQRGVDPYDGIDDHDGQLWHTCKDQIKDALATWSRRAKKITLGEQDAITQANIIIEANVMLNDIDDGFHGGSKKDYKELYDANYAWTPEYVEKSIFRIKQDVYKWFLAIFTGSCLAKVKSYGVERVDEIYKEFDSIYGKTTKKDLHDKELAFESGIVKKDGSEMYPQDDVAEFIRLLCKSQEKLRLEIPSDQHAGNEYLTEDKLVEVITNSIHPSYAPTIDDLRHKSWLQSIDALPIGQRAAERAKGVKGWIDFKVSLADLTDILVHKYRQNKKIWQSERVSKTCGKAAKVLAYGGPAIDKNGKGCWDCGSLLHRRGDSECPKPGALECAPDWLKKKIASGDTDDRPAAAKKRKQLPTCRYWKNNGHCKNGSKCRFPHPENEKGTGKQSKNGARLSDAKSQAERQSRFDKFKNDTVKVMVAAVKEARGHDDESDEEPQSRTATARFPSDKDLEKQLKGLISKAGKAHKVFMIRGDILKHKHVYDPRNASNEDSILEYGTACIDSRIFTNGAHGENVAALDNCAKVTASNVKSDFIQLDESEAACKSARIVGVGGEAVCGGRGVLMIILQHTKEGTWVLIDPDAIYLKPTAGSGVIRCISANKLEDMGMFIDKQHIDGRIISVLRDLRSRLEISVVREDGISVLRTAKRDIRNHKKNRALFKAIALIRAGKHCPVFSLQKLTESIETARHTPPFKHTPETFDLSVGNPLLQSSLMQPQQQYGPTIVFGGNGGAGGDGSGAGGDGGGKKPPQFIQDLAKQADASNQQAVDEARRQRSLAITRQFNQHQQQRREARATTGGLSVRQPTQEEVQRRYDQAIGQGSYENLPGGDIGLRIDHARQVVAGDRLLSPAPMPAPQLENWQGFGQRPLPSSVLNRRWSGLNQATTAAPSSAERANVNSSSQQAVETLRSLASERRREDQELARRQSQQRHEDLAAEELRSNMHGSDARREGVHSGYVAALNAMMGTGSTMRAISEQLLNHTTVQQPQFPKQRKSKRHGKRSHKGKHMRDAVGKRTAAQPPPNCKPGRHRRFRDDDDDKDPDYKQPRERKRSRFVSGAVRVLKTVNFSSAVGGASSGRCESSDGSDTYTARCSVDPTHIIKVLAIMTGDSTVDSDITSSSSLPTTTPTDEDIFASILALKVDLDVNHHYTHNLLRELQLTEEHKIYVINTAKLSKQQRSVLWHYRLGHVAADVPVRLSKRDEDGLPFAYGIDNVHALNCDCEICDKARFKVAPFKSVPRSQLPSYPPFFMIQVDGFGGQKSMGPTAAGVLDDSDESFESFACESIGGAKGGFNFVDVATGAITPRLYSRKSQFPEILRRFILEVAALQWQIRVIRASDSEIVNNGEVEEICAEWNILIQPTSQGTPEELGRVECANRDLAKIARGMLLSAPHLPPSLWGAAWVYAGVILWLLPKKFNNDVTPHEAIRGHPPDLNRLCIRVFGCPTEVRRVPKGAKFKNKQAPRTETMYFVGTEYPAVLVWLPSKNRIYRVSKRKVRCHEGAYIADSPLTAMQLKQRISFDEDESGDGLSVVDTVPTVRSLRIEQEQGLDVDPGESPSKEPLDLYLENNESIDAIEDKRFEQKLAQMLRTALSEPSLQQQLVDLVRKGRSDRSDSATNLNDGLDESTSSTGQGSSNSTSTAANSSVVGRYSLRNREKQQQKQQQAEIQPLDETAQQLAKAKVDQHKQKLPPLNRAKPGTRVKILTKLFDPLDDPGKYSKNKPKYTFGTIRSASTRGLFNVLWDDETRQIKSHWKDLDYLAADEDPKAADQVPVLLSQIYRGGSVLANNNTYFQSVAKAVGLPEWSEPYRSIATAEILMLNAVVLKTASSTKRPDHWPRTFMECLLSPKWREWLEAVLKEFRGWQEFQAAEEVSRSSRDPDHALVRIGELYTEKRDGSKKFRPYLMGNLLTAQKHYFSTFSGTVTADTIRFFFALATELLKIVWQADAKCAYLQSDEQAIPIYSIKPTFWDFVHMPIEELMAVRKRLLAIQAEHGTAAVRKLGRTMNNGDNIILLKKPLYGIPSAGHSWALTLQRHLTGPVLGFKRSEVDGCLYYKTENALEVTPGPYKDNAFKAAASKPEGGRIDGRVLPHRREAVWATEYIMMLTWTDDFPYFGTDKMVNWFNHHLPKLIKVDLVGKCEDFISIEVTQHADGSKEVTHSKYWLALGEKYAEQLKGRNMRVPMKPGVDKQLADLKPSEEEHYAVSDYPYRELVGSISFPSCHTKLEIRLAVSLISRHLHDWTAVCINAALDCLSYCVNTHDIGAIWTPGIDPHGPNVPYGYADSGFSAPRSQGGRIIKMNCGPISGASQRHSTVDTSTTAAELKEAYLLSNDICGIRNLMEEVGLELGGPTAIYEDNSPSISIIEGERNMADTTRSLEINMWKLRERSDMQQVELIFCRTYDQLADNFTKANPTDLFKYLRDCMNGYAAALLNNPDREMPLECVTMAELKAMLAYRRHQDSMKAEKAAENAKKKRRKK